MSSAGTRTCLHPESASGPARRRGNRGECEEPPPPGPNTYPTFGSPTIPIFRDVPNLPIIGCDLTPSPPFFGGI